MQEYLGPDGVERYTQRVTAGELRRMRGIVCHAERNEESLMFSPHWAGVLGILPGSDCGDQPMEAFHSPWTEQLETLGKDSDYTQALGTMQELFKVGGGSRSTRKVAVISWQ